MTLKGMMRINLWVKLMGILGIIVAAGAILTFVLINRATATQFRRFVLTGDTLQAENLAALLADYYTRQGSWQDVETFLATPALQAQMMGPMMPGQMGRGPMGGRMNRQRSGNGLMQPGEMMALMADRIILV